MTGETAFGPGSGSSAANRAAVAYVRAQAERNRRRDEGRIRVVLRTAGVSAGIDELCAGLRRVATLTINFHPDRIAGDGRSVAEALLVDGVYRSQFETSISNGGLTAYPGGDRDRWEERLFGGAYQAPGVGAAERPRYGGLDLLHLANGACPRFGSCHLRLGALTLGRATFFVGDSVTLPDDGGVLDRLEPVLAGLLERIAKGDDLGRPLTIASLVDRLLDPGPNRPVRVMGHALDAFLEAQVHGPITLADDVSEIVIDPSFRGSAAGATLLAAAERYHVRASWNAGSRLTVDQIPPEEPPVPEPRRWAAFCAAGRAADLARVVIARFATDGRHLDAAALGAAAASVVREPQVWEPWHDSEDALTRLKDLWHILVVYGHAAEGEGAAGEGSA
jgi:hypothetical protein